MLQNKKTKKQKKITKKNFVPCVQLKKKKPSGTQDEDSNSDTPLNVNDLLSSLEQAYSNRQWPFLAYPSGIASFKTDPLGIVSFKTDPLGIVSFKTGPLGTASFKTGPLGTASFKK